MLFLDREDPDRDINLYINSPGGSIYAGLAIYDTMELIRSDVSTICVGMAASMATVLLTAGTKKKRFALPNSTVHMHQAHTGAQGSASDVNIQAKEVLRVQKAIREIIADQTGKSYERIVKDSDRDIFMTATQAKTYGLVDDVLKSEKPSDISQKRSSSNSKGK